MRRALTLGETLLVPVLVWSAVLLAGVQALVVGKATAACWLGLGLLAGLALLARALWRRRKLRPLVAVTPRPIHRCSPEDFGVHPSATGETVGASLPRPLMDRTDKALRERRLVILCGERAAGKTGAGHELLKAGFGGYHLLRPELVTPVAEPPLVSLLSGRLLAPLRRYALWMDDLDVHLDRGLDPRVIERWLASGRRRVALATITRADYERTLSSPTTAAVALARAVVIELDAPPQAAADPSARYERALYDDLHAAALMRACALWRLLGLGFEGAPERVIAVARSISGLPVTSGDLARATSGPAAPVSEVGGKLIPHPALLTAVESELAVDDDADELADHELADDNADEPTEDEVERLVSAFADCFSVDAGVLLGIGQALGVRRRFRAAFAMLERARLVASPAELVAVSTAVAQLAELQEGASGARLATRGGVDYDEPMGPDQRQAIRDALPDESDGLFDPALPPEDQSFRPRFYRRVLHRAAARVAVLASLDLTACAAAAMCALAVRAGARGAHLHPFNDDFWKLLLTAGPPTLVIATWLRLYTADAARARLAQILAMFSVVTLVVAAAFLVADSDIGSVLALPTFFGAAVVGDWLLRGGYDEISRWWVKKHGFRVRVLLMGGSREVRACASGIVMSGRPVQPVAFLSMHETSDNDEWIAGTYAELQQLLQKFHIGELVIADHKIKSPERTGYIAQAHALGLDVRFVVNEEEVMQGAVGRLSDNGIASAKAALLGAEALELKRLTDYLLVTVTLPIWAFVIAAYAAYSWATERSQPIFVTEDRIGLGGIAFSMFRLRTRAVHFDGSRGTLPSGGIQAFCERAGLDELPQVFNVLRGEMSLVGPRPLSASQYRGLKQDQRRTLAVRPGMTGRWQVAWTYGADEEDMRAAEVDYLRRWRLHHDIALILRTPAAIWRRGWYLGDTELNQQRAALVSGKQLPLRRRRWTGGLWRMMRVAFGRES